MEGETSAQKFDSANFDTRLSLKKRCVEEALDETGFHKGHSWHAVLETYVRFFIYTIKAEILSL